MIEMVPRLLAQPPTPHQSMDLAVLGAAMLGAAWIQTMDPFWNSLLNFGALGVIVAWFMFRTESKLDRIERSLQRFARAQLIATLGQPNIDERVKRQAQRALKDLGNGDAIDDGDGDMTE